MVIYSIPLEVAKDFNERIFSFQMSEARFNDINCASLSLIDLKKREVLYTTFKVSFTRSFFTADEIEEITFLSANINMITSATSSSRGMAGERPLLPCYADIQPWSDPCLAVFGNSSKVKIWPKVRKNYRLETLYRKLDWFSRRLILRAALKPVVTLSGF